MTNPFRRILHCRAIFASIVVSVAAIGQGQEATGLGNGSAPVPVSVVAWWPGDGNADDIAGNNRGIAVNSRTSTGFVGQAFDFTGDDSYIRVLASPSLSMISNELALEAWVWHRETTSPIQRYLNLSEATQVASIHYRDGIIFALSVTGKLLELKAPLPVMPQQWYHVVGTFDGINQRLYVNGKLEAFAAVSLPLAKGTSDVLISWTGEHAMNGLIDEAAIYDRAISAEEIQSHFLAGSSGLAKVPVFSAISVGFPGDARLRFNGRGAKPITLQSSTNLIQWTDLADTSSETGSFEFLDTSAGAVKQRFYRALVK